MRFIKNIFELLKNLTKFGYYYLIDGTWLKDLKKIEWPTKKLQKPISKISTSEYISIESEEVLDEAQESRRREELLQQYFNYEDEEEPTFI